MKHRRLIFWEVLAVTALTALYSLVAPPIYTSVAQILPPVSEETGISMLSSMLSTGNLSSFARLGSTIKGTQNSELVAAILRSRTIRERVIDSCDFLRIYKFKNKRENALKKLAEMTKVRVTDEGIVVLAVEGKTAQYAAQKGNDYFSELDRKSSEPNTSRGRSKRILVGKRLAESESELRAAEESLTSFQKNQRVTAVDEETKATVETYAKLKAEKLASDVELEFARAIAGSANPYVDALRQQNEEFARALARMEQSGTGGFGVGGGVPLKGVPDIAAEYMRRLADYKLKQELRALLMEQYEQARILEVRDTPAITVLDPPRVPEKRSHPKRARMTLLALCLSL
ncbi:MAG: Wzz/FepE/Etk N-terminal domain-containing protein, partial [candidate division WOR-3 bacterium]